MKILIITTAIILLCSTPSFSLESSRPQEQLSMPLALTLSIAPGLGAGNYYANNISKGLTFTFIDATLIGTSIWAYTGTKVTDYSLISLGVIPTILLIFKVIQIKTVYDDVEAYNHRYIFSRP